MDMLNAQAGWLGIALGVLSGTVIGLFFHREQWLGGYDTWPRRMMRLGHIACFGLGFVNLGYALTLRAFAIVPRSSWSSVLLVVGLITMPLVCFLSAWRKPFRHLFFIPVLSVMIAVIRFIVEDLSR
jgi:hypothetical protein